MASNVRGQSKGASGARGRAAGREFVRPGGRDMRRDCPHRLGDHVSRARFPLGNVFEVHNLPAMGSAIRQRFLLSSIACACVAQLSGNSADWPQFRGPTGQGMSAARNPVVTWDLRKDVVWKTKIPGRGWSSPVLANGRIVVTSGIEELVDGHHELKVIQIDAESGAILWDKTVLLGTKAEGEDRHEKNSLASPTAIIDRGKIYAHFSHLGTVALNFSDGNVLWKQKIGYVSKNGTGGSPVLVDDLLVFNTDGFANPSVTALFAETGKVAWQTLRNHEVKNHFSHSTPLVIKNRGRSEIISSGSGMVGAYRPSDGKELWRVTYPMGFSVTTCPIVVGESVIVGTGYQRPSLYSIRLDGATGDLTASHVEWIYAKSMPKTPSPNYAKGGILTLEDAGRLQSLDPKTGDSRWMESFRGKYSASPVLAGDDLLYILSEEGLCFVVRIKETGCEILSEIDLGEPALASPIVVDETLYIRTESHLWKIKK